MVGWLGFGGRVSLCSAVCPGKSSVGQGGLELSVIDLPLPPKQILASYCFQSLLLIKINLYTYFYHNLISECIIEKAMLDVDGLNQLNACLFLNFFFLILSFITFHLHCTRSWFILLQALPHHGLWFHAWTYSEVFWKDRRGSSKFRFFKKFDRKPKFKSLKTYVKSLTGCDWCSAVVKQPFSIIYGMCVLCHSCVLC